MHPRLVADLARCHRQELLRAARHTRPSGQTRRVRLRVALARVARRTGWTLVEVGLRLALERRALSS